GLVVLRCCYIDTHRHDPSSLGRLHVVGALYALLCRRRLRYVHGLGGAGACACVMVPGFVLWLWLSFFHLLWSVRFLRSCDFSLRLCLRLRASNEVKFLRVTVPQWPADLRVRLHHWIPRTLASLGLVGTGSS